MKMQNRLNNRRTPRLVSAFFVINQIPTLDLLLTYVIIGASSSLATASSELENLRSSYQELETKLKEAELKREQAEKQLAERNSEHIREKGELELKKNADSETIRRQQKELNGLRKYMETAEHHWDLLNENILEPLGYPEQRRNLFPRDDLLQLAGDDCKDLISASRKICYNLNIKRSRTCDVRKLIGKMDVLPELVTDLQASSARGAAAMALTMCLAHAPGLELDEVTTGVPPDADVGALLDAVSGYDTRIARRIRHEEFYDKVVLPADEPLEAELQEELEAKARPAESGTQFTWTSSKDAPQEEPKTSTTASEEKENEEDGDPSSPMFFVLAFNVLNFKVAEDAGFFAPLDGHGIRHRLSFFADDVMLLVKPTVEEVTATMELLRVFGEASGLQCNLVKSSVSPFRCSLVDLQPVLDVLNCPVKEFPIQYLGLPLSVVTGEANKI
ncbi:uncharacterized protein [Lolium perenne]|uniref:uncharacterized protein n=1 Tax=Lolium perenne TaxID=4522 RepID=UPI003A994EED